MKDALGSLAQRAPEPSLDPFTGEAQEILGLKGIPSSVMKMEDAIELNQQRQRFSVSNTPLTVVKRADSSDEHTAVLLGSAREVWDKLRNIDKIRGFNWEVEVLVSLSKMARNRVVHVSLHSPAKQPLDWDAATRADHLEDRDAGVSTYVSRVVGRWLRLFEEKGRIDSGKIPASKSAENITVDGLIRLLKSLPGTPTPEGTVDGDPMVRVSLDGELGIAFRISSLDYPDHLEVLMSWLHNMVKFTEQNRDLYFDIRTRAYSRKAKMEATPPTSSFDLWMLELGDGE